MALKLRRVITGHDATGQAIVKIDEVATHAFTGRPGATGINVWTTEGFPADNDGADVDSVGYSVDVDRADEAVSDSRGPVMRK